MTHVLIFLTFPEPLRRRYHDGIKQKFPELTVTLVDDVRKAEAAVGEADVLITFGAQLGDRADQVMRAGTRLKWIQALGTGVDNIADRPSLRPDVVITNLHGIHGPAVSEAAIAAMLALGRDLPRVVRNQDRRTWQRWPARLIDGQTVGIFGIGAIAAALAPRCKAFNMRVVGISSAKRDVAGFDRMYGRDQLVEAVRDLDYLVLLTPYSAETRGIVGASVFAAMRKTAYLVNLARGGVVDEEALLAALREKRIAGAALDVFLHEPLPADHPFWGLENVIVMPHLGGFHDRYVDDALPVIEANMRKFLAGDTGAMINLVKR